MTTTPKHDHHPEAWEEYLPDLLIEANKRNGLVEIGQSTGNGEHSAIEIHPSQVLYIAQKLGMVRELTGDETAAREALNSRIFELERDQRRLRLTLLAARDRTEILFRGICEQDKRGHEDLCIEVAQGAALADILDLACADFEDEFYVDGNDGGRHRQVSPPTTPQQGASAPSPAPAALASRTQAARASVTPQAPGLFDGQGAR